MELVEDGSFDLRGFSPHSLTSLPTINCLLATEKGGGARCLDLTSGAELLSTELLPTPVSGDVPSPPLLCTVHPSTSKLVVAQGRKLGVRGAIGAVVLLRTILQSPASSPTDEVCIEILMDQVTALIQELQNLSSTIKSGQLAPVLKQLDDGMLARKTGKFTEKSSKWTTLSFQGPVQQLSELFEEILTKLKPANSRTAGATPFAPPSPALPVVSAIHMRLLLLRPDHAHLVRFEEGAEATASESKLMYCEAVRRLSLSKWPHKDYVWAVPKTMASAGFYHMCNPPMHNSLTVKGDKVSCFACRVYLYSWEPTDEPWSEHERHAMQCPFMRGEHTENIPAAVTEGTHPARVCAGTEDCVVCVSTAANCGLLATATGRGHITIWDLDRCLYFMEHAKLDITEKILSRCSNAREYRFSRLRRERRWAFRQWELWEEEEMLLAERELREIEAAAPETSEPSAKQTFYVTALSLVAYPDYLGSSSSHKNSAPVLVTGVTHMKEGKAVPLLLMHNIEVRKLPEKPKPEMPKPTPHHPPDDPLMDYWIDPLDPLPPPPVLPMPVGVVSSGPPPAPPSNMLDVLSESKGDTSSTPLPALTRFMYGVPLNEFSTSREGVLPEIQHIIPLDGGRQLAVSVSCSGRGTEAVNGSHEFSHGGLLLYRVFSYSRGVTDVEIDYPIRMVRFSSAKDTIVSMCVLEDAMLERGSGKYSYTTDVIATVKRDGEVVLYETKRLNEVARYSPGEGEEQYVSCAYCAQSGHLAVTTRGGRVVLLEAKRTATLEEKEAESPQVEDESSILSRPLTLEDLDQFTALTKTSPEGVVFIGSAPYEWQEISFLQHHRRSPIHMHLPQEVGRATHKRIWQYKPLPANTSSSLDKESQHLFELFPTPRSSLSLVSVKFMFANPQCLSDEASVSLLLPRWEQSEGGTAEVPSHGGPSNAELICGPVRLKPLVDVTGQSAQVCFCHARLMTSKLTVLWLLTENLFSTEHKNTARSGDSAAVPSPALRRGGSWHTRAFRHHIHRPSDSTSKAKSIPEHSTISVTLYSHVGANNHRGDNTDDKLALLLKLVNRSEFVTLVTLEACGYQVESSEYKILPASLQKAVEGEWSGGMEGEQSGGVKEDKQFRAMELLCWMAAMHGCRAEREGMVLGAVSRLMTSLLHACFIQGNRMLSHKCARLLLSLCRSEDDLLGEDQFHSTLTSSLSTLLPLLPLTRSAASVHWFLRLVATVGGSCNGHMTSTLCLTLLVELTKHLSTKSSLPAQLLQTHFQQEGSIFEPELYDIYLSYCQKATSKSQPKTSSLHTNITPVYPAEIQVPLFPPGFSDIPPTSSSSSSSSSSSQHVADRRVHTIYDSELQLLLNCSSKNESEAYKSISEFTTFKHGSFLLYGQRGLLETQPLEYSCVSVSGNATVQELTSQSAAAAAEEMTSASPMAEPTKISGYHFPKPGGRKQCKPEGTISQPVPPILTDIMVLPKELVMQIDALKSGVAYSVVLRFLQPIRLTDISVPSAGCMSSVSVDVWLEKDEEGKTVRVVHSSEIKDKSVTIGNLMPPPLCQFAKVTFIGRLGASRERVQVFLGSFFGQPVFGPESPLPSALLHSLEEMLLGQYLTARDRLTSALMSYADVARKGDSTSNVTLLKQCESGVSSRYQNCFKAQVRLARLWNFIQTQAGGATGSEEDPSRGVFKVDEELWKLDLSELASSRLYKLVGCLVDALLVLNDHGEAETGQTSETGPEELPKLAPLESCQQLPTLTEGECSLLFTTLCVHGVPKLHARPCAILIRLCGSQPWWGSFITNAALQLFSSSQMAVFNRERTLLQLSALCQRTYRCSNVMRCLFRLLEEKLSPLLQDAERTDQARCPDHLLLQWLVLLLSHILASLSLSNRSQSQSNLFVPVLSLPAMELGRGERVEGEGSAAVDSRLELGEIRREMKRRLAELQHQMKMLVGEEKMALRHEYEVIIQDYRTQRKQLYSQQQQRRAQAAATREPKPPPPPPPKDTRPVEPDPVLASLPRQLCVGVARGLMLYMLTLTTSQSWDLIPVACKFLSQLVSLSGHRFTLRSLLSQEQLNQLLAFCCQRMYSSSSRGSEGSLEWGQRALQCLLINTLYHGEIAPYLKVLAETETEEEVKEEKHDDFSSSTIPYEELQAVPVMETDTLDEEDSELTNDKPLPIETNITSIEGDPATVAKDETSQILEISEEKESALVPTKLLKSGGEGEAALPSKKEEPSSDSPAMTVAVQEMPQAEVMESFKPLPLEPDHPDLPSNSVVVPKLKASFSTMQQLKNAAKQNQVKVVLKKLSKHSLAGMKYAPGDYSGIPVYRKLVEGVREIDPQLPYQTFIISNTVEHRLQFAVEFPMEVELQGLAKKVYESVLLALLHAQPGLPPPSDTLEDLSEEVRVEEEGAEPTSILISAAMLCRAMEKLLERAVVPQSDVDVVAVLELWNVLNSLLPMSTDHKPHKLSAQEQLSSSVTIADNSQPTSEMKEQNTIHLKEDNQSSIAGLPIYSHRALNLLLDSLLMPSPPPSTKMWQLAVSLLHTALRHMWATTCVRGRSVDIDHSKLLKVLVRLFSSTSDASGFQGSVVTAMLSELVPMRLAGSSEKRGAHLLLEVMVILLESCTSSLSALTSPLLLHLINIYACGSHVRLLWGDTPSPSLCHDVTCLLRRLISAIMALLPGILEDSQQPGVVLYGSELDEDRRRYRYMTGANHEVKWVPLLSAQSTTNKVASELIQLLRQLLSWQLPDSAHLPLQKFCQNEFGSESQCERDFLKLSNPLMPLLSLVYADSGLLTRLLKLLNSTPSNDDNSQSSPSKVSGIPLSLVQNLFCNFVRFLDAHCKDRSCFFSPILQVLTNKQYRQGEKPVSKAFMNLIGSLTSEFEKQEELEQLHGFIRDGGARLIFDCLMIGCKHSSSLSENIVKQSISKLGQKETLKPFSENSHLINFFPSASVQLSPSRTSVRDLQFSGLSDHPSRSSTFHHTFHSHEEWLKISLSLPHPILLHAIQLYQPLGLMQNGPSAILVECASQSGLASTVPVTPLLQTSGLSCIKVELQNPVVAQDVVIHLRRPLVMDGLSLSHMYVLGVGYGGTSSPVLPRQEKTHPSAGWLYIIDQWLGLSDAIQCELMIVAATTPDLLPSCLFLLHSQETLGLQSSNQLERLLVAMATYSPEHGLTIVKHLLGFPFKGSSVPGGWQAPVSTTVALDLLHSLCLPSSEDGKQRLLLALRLLSNLPSSPEQLPLSHHLPLLMRTLSSTMWQGKEEGEDIVVEEEVFRSLVELAFSQDVSSQLKQALNSLVCSICHCHPELFPLILTNCQQAVGSEHPNVGNLLHTLAQAAQSPHCSKTLLESDLVSSLVKNIHDGFSELLTLAKEPPEEELVLRIRSILSKRCQYVAFFSDLCRHWSPAKDWISTPENSSFWPLLIEFLSRDSGGLLSSVELSFCQQVVCDFFEACICSHARNKVLFTRLLCNAVRGNYIFPSDIPSPSEDSMNQMTPPCGKPEDSKDDIIPPSCKLEDTPQDKILPILTPFLYKLMVDLILKLQPVSLVLKEYREETPKGLRLSPPPAPFSLPPTHEALHFHPSFPIGQGSYYLCLPTTYTLEDLAKLCQSQQQQVQPASTETRTLGKKPLPSEPPGNNFDIAKFSLKRWKMPHSKDSTTKSTEDLKVIFADPSRPDSLIPLEVDLSRLARLNSAPTSSLTLLLKHHQFYMDLETQEWLVIPEDSCDPSLLELFIQHRGLQPLAECVPSLYPFLWLDRLSGRTVPDPAPPHISGFKSHYVFQVPTSLPFHSIVMLSLGLRLCCYGNAMAENLPVAFVLLRLLLGVELNDPVPRVTLEQLAFLPYLVLLETFKQHPPNEKVGWELRQQALEVGVLHHTLHCLCSSGHHSPRIEERDDTNANKPIEEQSSQKYSQVTSSADKQYWAKGTGFGTGSTTSTWNMEAMLAKQKSEEKYVTLSFAILSEFLAVSEEHPQPVYCGPEVMSLLSASCLLPALAAYLLNDSILDISKHVELYQSVLDLLSSLAVNPSLRPLLLLPVFSDGDSGSSDNTSLATLTSKLRDITVTYQKTAKLKPAELKPKQKPPPPPPPPPPSPPPPLPPSPPPSSSNSSKDAPPPPPPPPPPPLPQQSKRPTSSSLNSPSDEADLAELVANILSTSKKVAATVQELERGREGRWKDPTSPQEPLDSSFDAYMKTMKPLQFDTHLFTEEDDDTRRITFHTPFHYEAHIHNASFALMYSIPRAHRLAREVTSISSSLPLSPSSSVFVRCDIERLDVMKVLITGPSETPYANGCFEFDVFFPQDYPKSPMMVNLMTTGHGRVRFNPNLYNDGKVCLSILNTWHGRPEEKWNSQTSSFLQVLVSIQSLILVPEPYFNEPGYEQYRGTPYGNQKSLVYNATIYVATVQWAMINQIRNPSPCFKEVILRHFYMRHVEVLSQCEQWKQKLAEGIQSMQEAGVTVTHLKELLRSLVKSVDTLRVELENIKPSDFGKKTDEELGYANDELPISIT